MAKAAPAANYSRQADASHVVANASSGDVDLTAISGCPTFAPQLLVLVNTGDDDGTAVPQAVVLVHEEKDIAGDPVSKTYSAPAVGGPVEIRKAIKAITAAGSGAAEVHCYWWDNASTNWND